MIFTEFIGFYQAAFFLACPLSVLYLDGAKLLIIKNCLHIRDSKLFLSSQKFFKERIFDLRNVSERKEKKR